MKLPGFAALLVPVMISRVGLRSSGVVFIQLWLATGKDRCKNGTRRILCGQLRFLQRLQRVLCARLLIRVCFVMQSVFKDEAGHRRRTWLLGAAWLHVIGLGAYRIQHLVIATDPRGAPTVKVVFHELPQSVRPGATVETSDVFVDVVDAAQIFAGSVRVQSAPRVVNMLWVPPLRLRRPAQAVDSHHALALVSHESGVVHSVQPPKLIKRDVTEVVESYGRRSRQRTARSEEFQLVLRRAPLAWRNAREGSASTKGSPMRDRHVSHRAQ